MASACVNNIGMSPESFIDLAPATYGWLSPRISFSRDDDSSKLAAPKQPSPASKSSPPSEIPDLEAPAGDFEFRLEDPVAMLPADELISDGKLVPLQLSSVKSQANDATASEIRSAESPKARRRPEISSTDPYLFSPKAPRCSSRWKDLLGLKKLYHNSNPKPDSKTTPSSTTTRSTTTSTTTTNPKSLKHFLQRSSKSATTSSSSLSSSYDASLSLPLLKDTDSSSSESLLSSSRFSLSSSSSSGHELEDLPRLSLDSEKQNPNPNPNPISIHRNPPKMRPVKPKQPRQMDSNGGNNNNSNKNVRTGRSFTKEAQSTSRGVSVDSPRMNSSGKIVFQSLERSSSSPSSFNGGPRFKHRGMERSYSANVRVTPVLNVPVCSLRGPYSSKSFGFGQLFSSPQKRETGGNSRGHSYYHSSNSKNRTDRI